MVFPLRIVQGTKGKKDYINNLITSEPKTGVLFVDFINQTISRKAKRNSKSYGRSYKTLIKHIEEFSLINDANIFTNSVNEDFIDDFLCFLEERSLKKSYLYNIIALVKCMAAKAARYGYAVDPSYDDVMVDKEDSFSVFLSANEITRIYYFIGLTKKQEAIRDLFIVGCLTALRYSDYSTLTKDNFQGNFIVKITKKTGTKVTIPLHDYVKEIYAKYNGEISKGLSIQHFNRYIKVICKKVGLVEEVRFDYTKGGKLITEVRQKWELISSHTARRSAATNMKLTGRFSTGEIMSFTGHTTERSLNRYLKITAEDNAKNIAGDNYFKK